MNTFFKLRQFFVGDEVFLIGREMGLDGVIGLDGKVFLLLDLGSNRGIEFFAANEILEQLVALVFFGCEEIGKGTLGNEYRAKELVVVEADNRWDVFPTNHFLFVLAVLLRQ